MKSTRVPEIAMDDAVLDEMDENAKVDAFLDEMEALLEPKTHCCHCTPGPMFQERHPVKDGVPVHAQIPNCRCKPENYVLKKNK